MNQIELNLAKSEALKTEGMEQSLERIHVWQWNCAFLEIGRGIARQGEPFTAEEILAALGYYPAGSRNAIGAAMNSLARELNLKRVGYRKAKRPSRHAAIIAVWQLSQ